MLKTKNCSVHSSRINVYPVYPKFLAKIRQEYPKFNPDSIYSYLAFLNLLREAHPISFELRNILSYFPHINSLGRATIFRDGKYFCSGLFVFVTFRRPSPQDNDVQMPCPLFKTNSERVESILCTKNGTLW